MAAKKLLLTCEPVLAALLLYIRTEPPGIFSAGWENIREVVLKPRAHLTVDKRKTTTTNRRQMKKNEGRAITLHGQIAGKNLPPAFC